VPDLPNASDVHGHANDHYPNISDGGDTHGVSDWGGESDSTSAHGHSDF
jgi:hypothetical protein